MDLVTGLASVVGALPPVFGTPIMLDGLSIAVNGGAYTGEDPEIGSAAVGLQHNTATTGSAANFVIRASGTTGGGAPLHLGGAETR